MSIEYFKQLLNDNNGIRITDKLVIYNDFELYNYETEEGKKYEKLEELVEENPEVKKIIEETEEFLLYNE